MNLNFMGKTVVVTGGSKGIGEATGRLFKAANAKVIILDLEKASYGEFIKCDVSNLNEVKKAAEKIKKVDVLVNNAGIINVNEFLKQDETDWKKMIEVNLVGVLNCSKVFGNIMAKNKEGKIVNLASTQAIVGKDQDTELGVMNTVVYAATKGAVATFTKALAVEFAKYNINVNAVLPTLTKTDMTEELIKFNEEDYKKKLPLARVNEAEDVANTILFLASEKARNITGQLIAVDAGYLLK